MITVLTLALAAAAATGLSRALRLPTVPLMVLAGVLGAWLLRSVAEVAPVRVDDPLPQLALAVLVFVAGLELDPRRVASEAGAAARVAAAQFVAIAVLGGAAAAACGVSGTAAALFGLGMAASSTIVGVGMLVERRQLFEPFGRLVLGVLLLQDLVMILAIAAIGGADEGVGGVLRGVLGVSLLLFAGFGVLRWIGPSLIGRLDREPETMLLLAIAVLFAFAGIAHALGLPPVTGAFIAGVSLSGFPVAASVRAPLESVAIFFKAVFFTVLGASLTLPPLQLLVLVAAGLAIVLVATPLAVTVAAGRSRFSRRGAVEAGLLLAQSGELALVLAVVAQTDGLIDPTLFSTLALVTVASMMVTPVLASDRAAWAITERLPARAVPPLPPLRDHVVLLGCGRNSGVLLDMLLLSPAPVVVVDRDPNTIARLWDREIPAILGDAAEEAVLAAAHAFTARVVIATMGRVADHERMLQHLRPRERGVRAFVRTFEESDRERLEAFGATVVSESEVAAAEAVLVATAASGPSSRGS